MSKRDPYEILGVEKAATEAEIRAAAKKHAKNSHPDKGGDPAEFNAGRQALVILTNPSKRKRFDETGHADEEPNNAFSEAIQIVIAKVSAMTNEFLMSNFDREKDPRRYDVVKRVGIEISNDILKMKFAMADGKKHADFLDDMIKRFARKKNAKAFDFLTRSLTDEANNVRVRVDDLSREIKKYEMAAELASSYDFRFDRPQPQPSDGQKTMITIGGMTMIGTIIR